MVVIQDFIAGTDTIPEPRAEKVYGAKERTFWAIQVGWIIEDFYSC
jgi:hypothetical protein